MKCEVPCSFGEVIDKLTILQIKKEKVVHDEQRVNIEKEHSILVKYFDKDDVFLQNLFSQLLDVNKKLWVMEDSIRHLSSIKQYDKTFIQIAENIHLTNDLRAQIKKDINLAYDSELCEEKLYNPQNVGVANNSNDVSNFEINDNNGFNFAFIPISS